MTGLADISRLLTEKGMARYGAEAINQHDHALQCAALAERAGASEALVTAALLHDIGHLTADDEGAALRGIDMRHEDRGADFLKPFFSENVTEPIRLHVVAKRYLCATNPRYLNRLSTASVNSLNVQGGPFNATESEVFAAHEHSGAAILLRVWDDFAKDPTAKTPPLSHYLDLAERVLSGPGKLILVVGPSGAGKDTLIAAARDHYAHDPHFIFPKRTVTRPCESAIEVHDSVSEVEFQKISENGGFCLHWQAHGLQYGIPNSTARAIAEGRTVVVNVSRGAIEAAQARFHHVEVINVTAPREILMARLAARNRATDGGLTDRVNRDIELPGCAVVEIVNDGPMQHSIAAFLDTLATTPSAHPLKPNPHLFHQP